LTYFELSKYSYNYTIILSIFGHAFNENKNMTLIIEKIERLFVPKYKSLDTRLWIQKLILKKYLKKN